MADKRPTVWTVLHKNDLIASDDTGMVPMFFSREAVEYFMSEMEWEEGRTFRIVELAVNEVPPTPTGKPFKIN